MEFKTQKQVDDYINSLGVFLNNDELYMKTENDDYILLNMLIKILPHYTINYPLNFQ